MAQANHYHLGRAEWSWLHYELCYACLLYTSYPDSVVNLHKKILKDAGLPHIRFHDLRHTFATLALQNGVDVKTVSSMLGHYDAGFTLRTYTHTTRQMQQKAAEKMGSFMAQIR